MMVAPLPWNVTSLPSIAGSFAATLSGLFATGAALAAAEPDAAGLAPADPDAAGEAAGLADAETAVLPTAETEAGAALAGFGAAELAAGALAGAAWPPHPSSARTDAADATPPAMC